MPILKPFGKVEGAGTIANLFYEVSITLIAKPDKKMIDQVPQ